MIQKFMLILSPGFLKKSGLFFVGFNFSAEKPLRHRDTKRYNLLIKISNICLDTAINEDILLNLFLQKSLRGKKKFISGLI